MVFKAQSEKDQNQADEGQQIQICFSGEMIRPAEVVFVLIWLMIHLSILL